MREERERELRGEQQDLAAFQLSTIVIVIYIVSVSVSVSVGVLLNRRLGLSQQRGGFVSRSKNHGSGIFLLLALLYKE